MNRRLCSWLTGLCLLALGCQAGHTEMASPAGKLPPATTASPSESEDPLLSATKKPLLSSQLDTMVGGADAGPRPTFRPAPDTGDTAAPAEPGLFLPEGWETTRNLLVYGYLAGESVPIGLYRVMNNSRPELVRQLGTVIMPRSQIATFVIPEGYFDLLRNNTDGTTLAYCLGIPGVLTCGLLM